MQEDMVKVCPDCGSEFQMWVERCLDCGANLVTSIPRPEALAPRASGGEEETEIPPGCIHLRTAAVGWIRRLSEDLDEAGIRHWITPPAWRRDPGLYVLPADQQAALWIDQVRYGIEVPGIEVEDALPRTPAQRRREPAEDLDVKLCPRCGGEYRLHVETCADCGIALVRPWDLEAARRKEAARPVEAEAFDDPVGCPACGERLKGGEPECPGCGLTLAQPDVCPNCGIELETHVGGCWHCGHELFESGEKP